MILTIDLLLNDLYKPVLLIFKDLSPFSVQPEKHTNPTCVIKLS